MIKLLTVFYKWVNDNLLPLLTGFVGAIVTLLIITYKFLLIILGIIAVFMIAFSFYLKRKYNKQCPYCGRYLKKKK